jgi:hypothetical protein
MSKHLTIHRTLSLDPARLFALLQEPAFLVARQKVQGALLATVTEIHRDQHWLTQEVHGEYHARTLTGIDEKKIEKAITTHEWNLAARKGRWWYQGPHGDLVRVEGTFDVADDAAGSSFRADFTATARIPLLGSRIEKRIIAEIDSSQPAFDRVLQEFIAALES